MISHVSRSHDVHSNLSHISSKNSRKVRHSLQNDIVNWDVVQKVATGRTNVPLTRHF